VRSDRVKANGAEIYYETRGSGPSVLMISGATGDAGHFGDVAERLADEFMVVTYDRRANSRSPRPAGWTSTSIDEQGDDAAGLLRAIDIAPAAVFGNSGGAIIALNLAVRHRELLRGAIFHEPPLFAGMAHPDEVQAFLQPIVEGAMARGGPRAAVEDFMRQAAGAPFDSLDPEMRERLVSNGDVLFGLEFGVLEPYRPDDAALAGLGIPGVVMAGAESPPFFGEVASWLSQRLGGEPVQSPGGHTPYFDRPSEFAEFLRPFLRKMS
jgi:pimeloyl-ACP methyl ester carboxylesterase